MANITTKFVYRVLEGGFHSILSMVNLKEFFLSCFIYTLNLVKDIK